MTTVSAWWRRRRRTALAMVPSLLKMLAALREKGFEIVVLGLHTSAWVESAPNLARLLGRPA
jgi:hypothetical protein